MKNLLNCPNCGAPVTAEKCPYCGSVFLDFAAIQVGAPSFVKFKVDGVYICARLVVTALDITPYHEATTYTDALGAPIKTVTTGWGCNFHLDAHAVCSENSGALVTIIKEG